MAKHKRKKPKGPHWGAKLRCLHCSTTIQSAHVHDFVACLCFKDEKPHGIAIDGGGDYCRMSASEASRYEVLDPGNYAWPSL